MLLMVEFQVKFLKALKHQRELGLVQLIQVKRPQHLLNRILAIT